MFSYIKRNTESIVLLSLYLLLAIASIVNIGTIAALIYITLVIISGRISPRSGFIILIMLYYVPMWCVHVPHVYLVTSCIVLLLNIRIVLKSEGYYRMPNILIIFLLFCVLRFFSVWNIADQEAYSKCITHLVYTLMHIIICVNLIRDGNDAKYVIKWWGYIGAMAAVLGFIHFIFSDMVYARTIANMNEMEIMDNASLGNGYADWIRWIWASVEPNYYGLSLLIPFAANTSLALREFGRKHSIVWILSLLGIFGTYSRSSLISAFVIIFISACFLKKEYKLLAIPIVLLVVGSILMIFPEFVDRINTIQDNIDSEGGSGRFSLWSNALNLYSQNPIWGIGTGQINFFARTTHNTFIQTLTENGIIGFLLFSSIYYMGLKRAYKLVRENIFFFAALVGLIINMNTVSCFNYRLDFSFFILLFSFKNFKEHFT